MSNPFESNNPGLGGLDELTSFEEEFISDLSGLPYVTGDILYYDGIELNRLPIGTSTQVLTVDGGLPSWETLSLSGYVPYTGATGDLDLGVHDIIAGGADINGNAVVGTRTITVTGTLSPAVTGDYTYGGTYNGYPYWQLNTTEYIWWRNDGYWIISPALGDSASPFWYYNSVSFVPPVGVTWLNYNGSTGNPSLADKDGATIYGSFTTSGLLATIGSNLNISGIATAEELNLRAYGNTVTQGMRVYSNFSQGHIEAGVDNYGLKIRANYSLGVIKFQTAGENDRMIINEVGRVGIGASPTDARLQIATDDTYPLIIRAADNSTNLMYLTSSSLFVGALNFIGSAGSITTGASGNLNSRYFQDNSLAKGYWDTGQSGVNWLNINRVTTNVNVAIQAIASQTADLLQIRSSSGTTGDLLSFASDGKLGLGIDTPLARLHIKGAFGSNGQFIMQPASGTGTGTLLLWEWQDSAGTRQAYQYLASGNFQIKNEQSGGNISLIPNNTSYGLYLTTGAYEGLITNTVISTNDNSGGAVAMGSSGGSGSIIIKPGTSGVTTGKGLGLFWNNLNVFGTNDFFFQGIPGSNSTGMMIYEGYDSIATVFSNYSFAGGTTGYMAWSPQRTEKMRLLADGKLGIGTTAATALLDVNSDVIRLRTAKTPASATATGNAGDICWDSGYIYVCIATDTWERATLASW